MCLGVPFAGVAVLAPTENGRESARRARAVARHVQRDVVGGVVRVQAVAGEAPVVVGAPRT